MLNFQSDSCYACSNGAFLYAALWLGDGPWWFADSFLSVLLPQ